MKEFAFDSPRRCVVGRSTGASVRLPGNDCSLSRHHCLLEVGDYLVSVHDLGSLNGTYVNGVLIGRRARDGTDRPESLSHLLCEGDELRVGNAVFRVGIRTGPSGVGESDFDGVEAWNAEDTHAPGCALCS